MIPIALTIAGSDPSGGAGIQADLKTFHQFGVFGTSVITLLTSQNTKRVQEVLVLEPVKVAEQLDVLLEDMAPQAAKTGALGNELIIKELAVRLKHVVFPLVVDPVMLSTHGTPLLSTAGCTAMKKLVSLANVATPNLLEAEFLSGMPVKNLKDMEKAARKIADLGAQAVLIKGGHLEKDPVDLFYSENDYKLFPAQRIMSQNTHGTGCALSAAITAELAKGTKLVTAIEKAKVFVTKAIETAPSLGGGKGPLNYHTQVN